MKKGLFITFEGIDGCGKSTQAKYLYEFLSELGIDVLLTREPGGCPISESVRSIVLDVNNKEMHDETEALLYAASRAQHCSEVILPALKKGRVVICDRFFDSSIAYQGFGRQLGKSNIMAYNRYAMENCMPDHTLFMDFRPEESMERMSKRSDKDRLERESADFFARVYDGYTELRSEYPERYISIDVSGTKYETRDKIRRIAVEIMDKWQEKD